MTAIDATPAPVTATPLSTAWRAWLRSSRGLLLAIAALVVVLWLPTPEVLSVAGQRMLAILAFAVVVWMTEAPDYAVSAIVVATLMA
jgi:solute carrier family 13 (sodium-dependent dicarboxylate transporter), member 2/3/5